MNTLPFVLPVGLAFVSFTNGLLAQDWHETLTNTATNTWTENFAINSGVMKFTIRQKKKLSLLIH